MNEEIEYAEMLEIPVSTVNVIRKNQRRRKQKTADPLQLTPQTPPAPIAEAPVSPLKDSVIAQVNDRLNDEPIEEPPQQVTMEADLLAESANSEGRLDFDSIPERIDTVRLYSAEETNGAWHERFQEDDFAPENENEGGRYALNHNFFRGKPLRITLVAEFAAACALCGAIFLTNVFMPNSAINTFFRAIGSAPAASQTDTRQYTDFTLSSVVSDLSNAELSLSPAGILSFTESCCVYPAADGTVSHVSQNSDGTYSVKISHSDTFTGVISGLNQVYYAVGDDVKANVPLGYTDGEEEVQVTMYSGGVLLNCFQLTEENCLAWVESDQ